VSVKSQLVPVSQTVVFFFFPQESLLYLLQTFGSEKAGGSRIFADKTQSGGKLLVAKDKSLGSDSCSLVSC